MVSEQDIAKLLYAQKRSLDRLTGRVRDIHLLLSTLEDAIVRAEDRLILLEKNWE